MEITANNLQILNQGFNAQFLRGIDSVKPQRDLVAMEIPSTTASINYAFLQQLPGMREWIGDREFNNLIVNNYLLTNRHWEDSISVQRNDILDDQLGLYANRFAMLGEAAADHPDWLVWQTLMAGFTTIGLDGQYYFDSDHQSWDQTGKPNLYQNLQSGSGPAWYLMDLSRSFLKPLIFQKRQDINFVAMDLPNDDNNFKRKEFLYGVDARYAVGYGFHQLAFGSLATLSATNFAAAKLAMNTQHKPDGSCLNVNPTHLICGPTNEANARTLLKSTSISASTNIWFNAVELVVVPALG